ncbi:MAG: hypothetical protein Q9210_006821 [Variospora velana]
MASGDGQSRTLNEKHLQAASHHPDTTDGRTLEAGISSSSTHLSPSPISEQRHYRAHEISTSKDSDLQAGSIAPSVITITITSLPPELICRIFELLDIIDSVLSLSLTAHLFHDIWTGNALSICQKRMMSYFPHASELVTKRMTKSTLLHQDNLITGLNPSTTISSGHHRLFLNNESLISSACRRLGAQLSGGNVLPHLRGWCNDHGGMEYFSESQRERFHGAYYRYWVQEFDPAVVGGLRHHELDLRSLFVRHVLLRKRRSRTAESR